MWFCELCRKHGITETTFYRWPSQYGGLQVNETEHLKALKEENRRLKKLVADYASSRRLAGAQKMEESAGIELWSDHVKIGVLTASGLTRTDRR